MEHGAIVLPLTYSLQHVPEGGIFSPLSHKCQSLLISELPKKKYNLVQTPGYHLAEMIRLWWVSGFGCKEEGVKPDGQSATHPGQWRHWGIGFQRSVHGALTGRWQFDFHSSFLPWHCSSTLQKTHLDLLLAVQNHCSVLCLIMASTLTCPTSHESLRLRREFKVLYPFHSKREYLTSCWVVILPPILKCLWAKRNLLPPPWSISDYWKLYLRIDSVSPSIFCSLVLDHP